VSALTRRTALPLPRELRWLRLAAVWVVLIAAPLWMPLVGGYTDLAARIVVFGLAAMSLNFLMGFTGQVSFGHAAYFGLGVYGAGFVLLYFTHSTPLALIAGILLGGVSGAIIGALISRQRGIYFALVTIAFQEVFYYIAYKWDSVTGGYDGLRGFQRAPIHFGLFTLDIQRNDILFYYFVLSVFAIVAGAMGLILRSPLGRTFLALRENERRARFLGVPADRYIWLSFTISAFCIAAAGALNALLNNFSDPSSLDVTISGELVVMAVLGGIHSFWGPLLGAAVFVVVQNYLSGITINWLFFVGLIFVVVVMFFPRGLLGVFRQRRAA